MDVVHEHHDPLVRGQARQHVVDADVDQLGSTVSLTASRSSTAASASRTGLRSWWASRSVSRNRSCSTPNECRSSPSPGVARRTTAPLLDRELGGVLPEGGLARARLPDEHEAVRPTGTEELVQRRDLAIAPDEAFPSAHDGTLTLGTARPARD